MYERDKAACHIVMAELELRGASPKLLVSSEPAGPNIEVEINGTPIQLRVKAMIESRVQWPCLPGQGERVFGITPLKNDFIVFVKMSHSDNGLLVSTFIRSTHDVLGQLRKHGEGNAFRRLTITDEWHLYRNDWQAIGLSNVAND
jgi:hypothetical protein